MTKKTVRQLAEDLPADLRSIMLSCDHLGACPFCALGGFGWMYPVHAHSDHLVHLAVDGMTDEESEFYDNVLVAACDERMQVAGELFGVGGVRDAEGIRAWPEGGFDVTCPNCLAQRPGGSAAKG